MSLTTDRDLMIEVDAALDLDYNATGFWPHFLLLGLPHYHAIQRWHQARNAWRPTRLPNSYKGVPLVVVSEDHVGVRALHEAEHEVRAFRSRQRVAGEGAPFRRELVQGRTPFAEAIHREIEARPGVVVAP